MKQSIAFCLLASALILNGCNRDDENVPLTGGKGGSASLRVTTRHHSKMIDSSMVYIKYAANSKPATYDDSARVVRGASDTVAVFSGLKTGTYYLYGKGWDPGIGQEVLGGIPFVIATDGQTYNMLCPVSEDH